MAQNQNLVPNLKSKALLILAVVIVATIGLFERRTLFTLNDGTQISGKVLAEQSTESFVTLMRASGAELTIPRDRIAEEKWFNLEVDINLGLDLRGGTALRYRIDLDKFESGEKAEVLERTVETFKKRLDTMGVKELSINSFGEDEISIELPGVTMEESQAYEQVVQSLGSLRFLIVAQSTAPYLNLSEEEQRLKDHLQQLTEEKGRWTPRSVDLSQFDVDGAPGVRYQWFPSSVIVFSV